MAKLPQNQAGPHPVYSAVNPNTTIRGGGIPTSADRPAKVLRESWRGKNEGDPAADIPGMPPNFADEVIPHVITFQGIVSSVARVYRPSDEAIKDSFENARFMRNDCSIMECLEQRKRSTALLDWRLEPEDENDESQKWLCEKLTPIIKQIPRFMQYRESLLEALWYGKYAVQHRYRWKKVEGKQRLVIDKWLPVLGDKLVFRYDDGTQEFDPDQVGIRVGAGFTTGSSLAKRWSVDRINKVEPTDYGLAYMLEPFERDLLAIHKHQIEDGEYEEPRNAGRIHGIGIRSRIYWVWFQKQESLAWLMEYLERSAFGIEIWYYPWGNDQAKQKTMEAAQERIGGGRNIVLVPRPMGEESMAYGVERIEPGMAGVESLKDILSNYFGHQIKRYILGQVLTTEAESTGLGSNLASIHLDTYLQIVKYDSINLQETLTTDLVEPLKKLNFPKFADVPVKFVIDTESPDVEGKLQAWRLAYEMGCKLKERDVMDLIGAESPEEDEDVLQDPQAAGAGQQAQQEAQAAEYSRQTEERKMQHQEQLDNQKLEHERELAEKEQVIEAKKLEITAQTENAKMQAAQQQAAADAQFKQQQAQQQAQTQAQQAQIKQQHAERGFALKEKQLQQAEQTDWTVPDYKQGGYTPNSENADRQRLGKYSRRAIAEAASQAGNPTEAQKAAGNYRKGHVRIHGLDVSIENAKGSVRSGTGAGGKSWSVELPHHYGYIRRTEGKDGDHVDAFIGPHPDSEVVFVVDQLSVGGKRFDEHKVMLGWKSATSAVDAYMGAYEQGWQGFGEITALTIDQFKAWLADGDTTKRIAGQVSKYAKKFEESEHPRDDTGKFAEGETLAFSSKQEAQDWIDVKAKEHGGKRAFYASDEYAEAYPTIKKAFQARRRQAEIVRHPEGNGYAVRLGKNSWVSGGAGALGWGGGTMARFDTPEEARKASGHLKPEEWDIVDRYAAGDSLFNTSDDSRQKEFAGGPGKGAFSGATSGKSAGHKPLIGQQGLFKGVDTVQAKRKKGAPDDRQKSLFSLSAAQRAERINSMSAGEFSRHVQEQFRQFVMARDLREQFAKAYYGESSQVDQDEFWNEGVVGWIKTVENGEPKRYSRDAAGGMSVQRYARFQPAVDRS